MERPVSSEEKLLKLIRKAPAPKQLINVEKKNKKTQVDFLGLGNRLLMFSILGLVIYIEVDHFVLKPQRIGRDISAGILKDAEPVKSEVGAEEKSFSFYQAEFERRNIFLFPWEKTNPNQVGEVQSSITDLKTLIKVSGILMGASPQVIVEDIKTQQTFFLSPGESVLGATVEEIRAERVIFNFNGHKVEMVP